MPPQSRGSPPSVPHSQSAPDLSILQSSNTRPDGISTTEDRSEAILQKQQTSSVIPMITPLSCGIPSTSDEEGEEEEEGEANEEEEEVEEGDLDTTTFTLVSSSPSSTASSPSSSAAAEEEEDDEEAEEEEADNIIAPIPSPSGLLYHQTSRSYSSLTTFAPPFYNRPPTPLPPSPSLTSLFRPNFSTTPRSSRPTTPDSSDVEDSGAANTATTTTGTATPSTATLITRSAKTAAPVPRAAPKVPTYEYYGFVLYLTSSLAFLIYLLWSYLPSPFLHQLGIYYYPNRWWSLAIPAWLVMLIVWIYVALASYNIGYLTLGLERLEGLVDEASQVAVLDERGRIVRGGGSGVSENFGVKATKKRRVVSATVVEEWRTELGAAWSVGTDAVMDIPIGGVCEILYGDGRINDG